MAVTMVFERGPFSRIYCANFLPEDPGSHLAVVAGDDDGSAWVWDAQRGGDQALVDPKITDWPNPRAHHNSVLDIRFSDDGARIASGSAGSCFDDGKTDDNGSAKVWEIDSKQWALSATIQESQYSIRSVSFRAANSGELALASENGTGRVYVQNTKGQWARDQARSYSEGSPARREPMLRASITSTGNLVHMHANGKGKVSKDDLKKTGTTRTRRFAVSPNGRYAAGAFHGQKTHSWDLQNPTQSTDHGTGNVNALDISDDRSVAVSATAVVEETVDGKKRKVVVPSVSCWNAGGTKELADVALRGFPVRCVGVCSDGSRIVAGSENGQVIVWDNPTSTSPTTIPILDNRDPRNPNLPAHASAVTIARFHPLNKSYLLTASWDGYVRVWTIT